MLMFGVLVLIQTPMLPTRPRTSLFAGLPEPESWRTCKPRACGSRIMRMASDFLPLGDLVLMIFAVVLDLFTPREEPLEAGLVVKCPRFFSKLSRTFFVCVKGRALGGAGRLAGGMGL